ncbi:hypothetical protein CR203_22700 [Salipaludibacillus neizhouensis]|uniref:Uncharacterized protein n=1 Tax=Salipaludibacillus neizhouensis TaxID=885475 RepID=A0A3A9K2C2_9BACI|nr:hypothetical protein [Salipaludibacillus neizhouensis]RKL65080.1 hypothetical protein CR203_22700 [Salipaludibacillus neizhouensis]
MIEQLKDMDADLKVFICKKLFEERIGIKNEIINEAIMAGFDEQDFLNGLDIFLYNELVSIPKVPNAVLNKDILINDSKFHELKSKGYL